MNPALAGFIGGLVCAAAAVILILGLSAVVLSGRLSRNENENEPETTD